MKTRIRTKLVLVLVALVLVPMLIFSLFTVRLSINAALENSTNYQINSMKKIGSAVDSLFQELDRASLFLIGDGRVRSYLSQDGEDPAATASSVYNVLGYLSNNSTMIKSIQVETTTGRFSTGVRCPSASPKRTAAAPSSCWAAPSGTWRPTPPARTTSTCAACCGTPGTPAATWAS